MTDKHQGWTVQRYTEATPGLWVQELVVVRPAPPADGILLALAMPAFFADLSEELGRKITPSFSEFYLDGFSKATVERGTHKGSAALIIKLRWENRQGTNYQVTREQVSAWADMISRILAAKLDAWKFIAAAIEVFTAGRIHEHNNSATSHGKLDERVQSAWELVDTALKGMAGDLSVVEGRLRNYASLSDVHRIANSVTNASRFRWESTRPLPWWKRPAPVWMLGLLALAAASFSIAIILYR
jgi:hypothetical protein